MLTNPTNLNAFDALSAEVKFYTISDIQKMTQWSQSTVQKMFNDPRFPAANFGKIKVVESHALIRYFSERHDRYDDPYWR